MDQNQKTVSSPACEGFLGLVLRIEGGIVYVWYERNKLKELKFPILDRQIEPGDFVRFTITQPRDGIQFGSVLYKDEECHLNHQDLVIFPRDKPRNEFRFLVNVGIPPPNTEFYRREMAEALDYDIQFYCYSHEFGTVISFHPLPFDMGRVYKGLVTRIPIHLDWLIPKTGTMFMLTDLPLEPIIGHEEVRILSTMPWNQPPPQSRLQTPVAYEVVSDSPSNYNSSPSCVQSASLMDIDTNKSNSDVNDQRTCASDMSAELASVFEREVPVVPTVNFSLLEIGESSTTPEKTQQYSSMNHQADVSQNQMPSLSSMNHQSDVTQNQKMPSLSSMTHQAEVPKNQTPSLQPAAARIGDIIASTLSGLRAHSKHGMAAELEKKLLDLCIQMQLDLLE